MKKEGVKGLFNSQGGKISLALLFSIVLIFVVISVFFLSESKNVNALIITNITPSNFTYNGSRNINFTFNVTWSNSFENLSNCSIYTNASGIWDVSRNFTNATPQTGDAATDVRILNGSLGLSYANFTFSGDGNYTFNIGCRNANSSSGILNFSGGLGGSGNRTFFIDTVAPTITLGSPNGPSNGALGGVLSDATEYNITSYDTASFNITVNDNSTQFVWTVLNDQAFIISLLLIGGTNESINRSMTAGTATAQDSKSYIFNMSGLLNFNSSFAGPGPHSVTFCANDTIGRVTCTNRSDFIIKGMNITQMENIFSNMQECGQTGQAACGAGALSFGGLNITLGNGTEIPDSTFMNPINGVAIGGITHKNFTFIFNFSANAIVWVVGGSIDESQFANASNSRVNSTPTTEIRQQLGTGYQSQLAWADIRSFIPSEVSYLYGIIQVGGIGYSKRMYCNGTTMSDPQCHKINQCNATVFGIYNYTSGQTSSSPGVIPSKDACWLESGVINGQSLAAGYTYIFVSHFSGGLGGADFGPPNATFNLPRLDPANNTFNTTSGGSRFINFTVDDTDSTGVNLTANFTINLTITLGGTVLSQFNYINKSSATNLTCTTPDIVSPGNSTRVFCNVTFGFNSNGTYLVNITARDDSNNSNAMNLTTSWFKLTVDQIPPIFVYYNFTNSSNFDTGGSDVNGKQLGVGDLGSVRQGFSIFAKANWTDNLTQVLQGALQFYNASTASWRTLNNSPTAYLAYNNNSETNFSYPIPSGHNEFEGKNVSFRIIANDTLGNVNNSNSVTNFTIQINDTTKPTLLVASVAGQSVPNFTNTTNAVPTIVWNTTDQSAMAYIAIQVDSLTDSNCGGFKNFTTVGTTNANRNGSITILNTGGCTSLGNGSHTVRLTTQDGWGNAELYIHQFNVQTGVNPIINLSGLDSQNGTASSASPPANGTTVTSNTGINFSSIVGSSVTLRSISFTSSCNSTGGNIPLNGDGVTNNTAIKPFQGSCTGQTGNRTITVTATDSAGVSTSNFFQFLVDDTPPSLAVSTPTNGLTTANASLAVTISAKDDVSNLSMFGYYLDSRPLAYLNTSFAGSNPGANETNSLNFTVTSGTHTIKFTAADAIGTVANNSVNSSLITFTVVGNVTLGQVNNSITSYMYTVLGVNVSNVSMLVKQGDSTYAGITAPNDTSVNTFQILYQFGGNYNVSNVSLTEINGSAANWDKINFTPFVNNTIFTPLLQTNWTNTVLASVWFNASDNEFLPDNNSYYGVVVLNFNISGITATAQEFWWIQNVNTLSSRTNISQCQSVFTPTTTTPCWNYTSGGRTIIQVPHFATAVTAVNDSSAPTINVTTPLANQTVSMFVPNITVSNDAVSCNYQLNSSTPSNQSMTLSNNVCIGQIERFKNLDIGDSTVKGYNVTFWVTDSSGNINQYRWGFNISDTTSPNNGAISSSPSTTTATVTVTGANETVNVTVNYGTVNTSLGSFATNTAFNTTESVTLGSTTALSASTTYFYNVTVCDFNGNCVTNSSLFSFKTSAAAAAAAAAASSSSGGGGSAAGATPTTTANVAASSSRQWDSIQAGSAGTLTIHNADIAIMGVTIDVANTVSNPSITVASLSSNSESTEAAAKVYQYLQITKSNIADSDASKITISFAVPKSWLASNNVKEDDIVLYRFSDGKWNALPTAKTGEDANYYMYQSTTHGFSTFAVGNKEAAPTAPPTQAPTAPTTPETPAPATPSAPQPAAPSAAPSGLSTTTIAWIVVAVIVVIAAIGYFIMQRRKE